MFQEFEHLANLEEFRRSILKRIEKQYEDNEEIQPVAFLYLLKDDKSQLAIIPASHFFGNKIGKHLFVDGLRMLVERLRRDGTQVLYFIMITEAWMAQRPIENFDPKEKITPSKDPNKVEVLMMHVEGERNKQVHMYSIHREKEPKKDFITEMDMSGIDEFTGVFCNVLYKEPNESNKN